MVRSRYCDSVMIQVSGPIPILPESITRTGRLGMTWLHFLNGSCGLQLDADSGYFITAFPSTSQQMECAARLTDEIKVLVNKFEKKSAKYCVYLKPGSPPDAKSNSTGRQFEKSGNPFKPSRPIPDIKTEPMSTAPISAHFQTVKKTGIVFEIPTPAIVIPTRGTQLVTPIPPPQQTRQTRQSRCIPLTTAAPGPSGNRDAQTPTSVKRPYSLAKLMQNRVSRTYGISSADPTRKSTKVTNIPNPCPSKRTRLQVAVTSNDASNNNTDNKVDALLRQKNASRKAVSTSFTEPMQSTTKGNKKSWVPKIVRVSSGNIKIEPVEASTEDDNENDEEIPTQRHDEVNLQNDQGQDLEENGNVCGMNAANDDIKSSLEEKLDRFDESMLNQIQREIKRLKKNKLWERNTKRSPLACQHLLELFKDDDQEAD